MYFPRENAPKPNLEPSKVGQQSLAELVLVKIKPTQTGLDD